MDPLSQEQINSMLGLTELDRVNRTVLDDKPRQLIEKLEIESDTSPYSVVVLKYGHGKGICTEALAHQLLFQYEDPVAKLLFHTVLPNSTHVLVTEWVEGDSPDFTEQNTVQKVFYALGQWLGCFRIRVHSLEETWTVNGQRVVTEGEITRRLVASAKHAVRNPETLRSIGGEHLLNIYGHLATDWARDIARRISITPTTFNPGDLSLHNILVNETRTTFLDFESCIISPMTQVIDVLGEPWGSLPEGNLVETP